MAHWTEEYFADCDAMRLDDFMARHTEDVAFNFNNNPLTRGKDEFSQALSGFWDLIAGVRHEFIGRWEDGNTVILEAHVLYERKDGQVVTVPTTSIVHRNGDLVDRISFYNDPAPIFA